MNRLTVICASTALSLISACISTAEVASNEQEGPLSTCSSREGSNPQKLLVEVRDDGAPIFRFSSLTGEAGSGGGLRLVVSEPGLEVRENDPLLPGSALWEVRSTTFPTGFGSRVVYGQPPEGAVLWGDSLAMDTPKIGAPLEKDHCYQVALISAQAASYAQFVLPSDFDPARPQSACADGEGDGITRWVPVSFADDRIACTEGPDAYAVFSGEVWNERSIDCALGGEGADRDPALVYPKLEGPVSYLPLPEDAFKFGYCRGHAYARDEYLLIPRCRPKLEVWCAADLLGNNFVKGAYGAAQIEEQCPDHPLCE